MVRLALSLLGTFQASAGEQPITHFATDKVRALLAYLAVEADRPHRRDALAALLWPDWDDSGARSNLRLALHRLREAIDAAEPTLSDNLFGITRETVQVNAAAVDVDVARFVALQETSEIHPHRLLHLCPSCLEQLSEAVALYSGELLAGLSIGDAPAFEQWELTRREELGRRVLSLLYRLADAFEQLGDPARGLLFAHRQLALDPYREEAHRQAIRCYALQGERAAALAHFDRARQLLADELGVEPDPITLELVEQVRSGRLTDADGRNGSNHAGRPQLYHFPAWFTPFFGRAAEIAQLVERLAYTKYDMPDSRSEGARAIVHSPPARLLTMVAPGGMGKTRLAIAVAEKIAERPGFPDGIYFLSLVRIASAGLLPSALAWALGLNLAGAGEPIDQVVAFLRSRRALLVLDNFEHLLDGVDLIVRLIEEAPGLSLLVTSREALNVRAEERYILDGLSDEDGANLFAAAAARVRPDYTPDPAGHEAIRTIVHDVGGMPLAIELSATWMRLMDAPSIAAHIRADLDFLSTNLRDLPERQRSMRAVFDYMWTTLSPPEQEALAMLSVMRGTFRLDAVEAISGTSPGVIALLLDHSLLRSTGAGRFEQHELLRQYAAGKLAAEPPREAAARERHAAHYLALLAEHGAALNTPGSKEALAALLRNLANVREAWRWVVGDPAGAAAGRRLQAARTAAASLELFYRFSGRLVEGIETIAIASAALTAAVERGDLEPADGYPVAYDLLRREALLLELNGQGEAALERLARARDGWNGLGERRELARVLCETGYVDNRLSRPGEARQALNEALSIGRALGDDRLIADALHNLGNVAMWGGEPLTARTLLEESVDHYQRAGEQHRMAGAYNDIGMTFTVEGDYENARAYFRRSQALSELIGDQPGINMALTNLGAIALDRGDLAEAEVFSRRSQSGSQDTGDKLMLSVSIGNLGHVALARGERAAALRLYRDTATLTRESGYHYMLIEAVMGLAALAADLDPAAGAHWLAAVDAWRSSSGFLMQTLFVERLHRETETRLRAALGDRFDALWAEGTALPLETAADEAAAWASGEGMVMEGR